MEFLKNKRNVIIIAIVSVVLYTTLVSWISIVAYKNHLKNEITDTFKEAFSGLTNTNKETSSESTDSSNNLSGKTNVKQKEEKKKATEIVLNQTLKTENWEITFNNVSVTDSFDYQQESLWDNSLNTYTKSTESGEIFVLMEGTLKNIGTAREEFVNWDNTFKVLCDDNYSYTLVAAENPRTSSYSISLEPLYSANIQIYTNLPQEALKDNAQFNFVIDGQNFSYTHKLSK
ncbi:MAG: hypothetical protein IJX99_01600 [Clostridia bacterium]|nr:hypothetical protein [Clostridia bacterium]